MKHGKGAAARPGESCVEVGLHFQLSPPSSHAPPSISWLTPKPLLLPRHLPSLQGCWASGVLEHAYSTPSETVGPAAPTLLGNGGSLEDPASSGRSHAATRADAPHVSDLAHIASRLPATPAPGASSIFNWKSPGHGSPVGAHRNAETLRYGSTATVPQDAIFERSAAQPQHWARAPHSLVLADLDGDHNYV